RVLFRSPADAENRLSCLYSIIQNPELILIPIGVALPPAFENGLFSVRLWREVISSLEDETIHFRQQIRQDLPFQIRNKNRHNAFLANVTGHVIFQVVKAFLSENRPTGIRIHKTGADANL